MTSLSLHHAETREGCNGSCNAEAGAGNGRGIQADGGRKESVESDNAGRPKAICTAISDVAGHADGVERIQLFEEWVGEYKPLLGKSLRWTGFCWLMKELLSLETPVVIETGTLREPGNWKGDGQSTRLWNWIMERKQGIAVSVDGDVRACELARRECPKVHVVCQDSVSFLRGFFPFKISLLYLDSSDDPVNQLAELTAAWGNLPSGCLIASDDSPTKAVWTRKFLGEPEFESYLAVWRKN